VRTAPAFFAFGKIIRVNPEEFPGLFGCKRNPRALPLGLHFYSLPMQINDNLAPDRECSENEMKAVVYTALTLLGGLIFLGTSLIVMII
jgi:hypothetical protein